MNAWRRWREVRARFLIIAALTAFASGMVAARTPPFVQQRLAGHIPAEQEEIRLHRIDSEWFGNKGPSVLLLLGAIVFTVGGIATEPGRGSTLFTLALPVSRRRVLLTQFGVTIGLVAALGIVGALGSMLGGFVVSVSYPAAAALTGVFVQVVSVAPFAALLMALQTATRRGIASASALIGVALVGPPLAGDYLPPGAARDFFNAVDFPPMIAFEPAGGLHTIGVAGLISAVPWTLVTVFVVIAAAAALTAAALFERAEP
jgi:hypothetical protein